MNLELVKSEGIAHNSYLLSDWGEAVVVDPRRDCDVYRCLAEKECARIKYILETHRNEDYVIGSLELQNTTDAEIGHSKELAFKYGEHNLGDGETLNIGSLKIKALYTPGHTNESMCYAVYKPSESAEAIMVFTGDNLFVGAVGRTDLYGKEAQPTQAAKLHQSIREQLLPLGDHVLVYPAHGAGSVCGHAISEREFSTIGYEKQTNPFLQLSEEAFVERSVSEMMIVPPYFRKMEEYNLNGPPLLAELAFPKPFTVPEFEAEMGEQGMMVVDTREPYAFAGAFIPGALSMWLDGAGVYPGWVMDTAQYIIFVHERPSDIEVVARRFRRLGFDNMCGYLCTGMMDWIEKGKPISTAGVLSVSALKSRLEKNEVFLVDVREPSEWKDGVIEGAERIFFGDLADRAASLPRDKPVAVICSVGNRTSTGVSILKRAGFSEVYNVLGGMDAWTKLGYPTKKE
jgi:hydroxyacylglutathione hydrolase